MPYRTEKPIYVNADKSKVVDEDSPEAAFQLVGENGEVTDQMAEQYGLHPSKAEAKAAKDEAKADAAAGAPADKAEPVGADEPKGKAAPKAETKAVKAQEDK